MMPGNVVAIGRQALTAVMLVAKKLRPWYACRRAMISVRPVCKQAIWMAVSMASVPELVKNVWLSWPGAMSARRQAAST